MTSTLSFNINNFHFVLLAVAMKKVIYMHMHKMVAIWNLIIQPTLNIKLHYNIYIYIYIQAHSKLSMIGQAIETDIIFSINYS